MTEPISMDDEARAIWTDITASIADYAQLRIASALKEAHTQLDAAVVHLGEAYAARNQALERERLATDRAAYLEAARNNAFSDHDEVEEERDEARATYNEFLYEVKAQWGDDVLFKKWHSDRTPYPEPER